MKGNKDIINEAISSLSKFTGIIADLEDGSIQGDAFFKIANEKFVIETKSTVTKGNKGITLMELKNISRETNLPVILITKYIPVEIAKEYVAEGVNYLDVAGNCSIRQNNLMLLIEGKKMAKAERVAQTRAFQESGIKLILLFLVDPQKTQLTYRNLAELADISLGSVGIIMQELTDLNFILKTKQTRKLKNIKELLARWITAYHDTLRPRLLKKQMRFVNPESYQKWKDLDLNQSAGLAYWGGEPGAHLLNSYLHPGKFTIYTDRNWQSFKEIGLVPDDNGKVELLDLFWSPEIYNGIPPVLIYADLMSSGSDRNIETANMILNNELQYIKQKF